MADGPVTLKGAKEAQENMQRMARALHGDEMVDRMQSAALEVEGAAKKNLVAYESPSVGGVDTGRLRASISSEVRVTGTHLVGAIGSAVEYAAAVEVDTPPHFPPVEALEGWAERHGTSAWAVALKIAQVGTQGKYYLARALESMRDRCIEILKKGVEEITK